MASSTMSLQLGPPFLCNPTTPPTCAAAQHALHPLAALDMNGVHVWCNQAYERFIDCPATEIVGATIEALLQTPPAFNIPRARLAEGQSVDVTLDTMTSSLRPIYAVFRLSPYADLHDQLHGVAVAVDDQTETRRALGILQRYAAMVTYSSDAIISLDGKGMIETWNAGAQNLYGYTADAMIGRPLTVISEGDLTLVESLPELALAGEVVEGEVAQRCQDGSVIWASLQASPIFHRVEGINGVSVIARDITDRRRMEVELRAAKEKAELAAVAKSQFLANMSHEIRTPMNGVLGMTDLLLETPLSPEQQQYAETVKSSGDTLLQLINDILDFSKIEAGHLELEDIAFDLRAVCNGVLDMMAQAAGKKGLELTGFVELGLASRIMGDPGRLRQVLLNLVNNGVKFTTNGQVAVRVEERDGQRLHFEVRDTGIGIPEDRVSKLFRAFTQVDASTTRRFGGTGLGLAISRELVDLMGGTLAVDSVEGKGSTFYFDLPLRPDPTPDEAPLANLEALRGLRLLVVDDVQASADILETHCNAWGSSVTVVTDSAQATDQIASGEASGNPFAVVLLDNGLLDISGLELGRQWFARWPSLQTSLVLMTSHAQRGDARQAYDSGFAAYLTKPVKTDVLQATLQTIVGAGLKRGTTTERPRLVTRHSISEDRRSRARILVAEDNPVNQRVTQRMLERLGYRPVLVEDGGAAVAQFAEHPFDVVLMDCQMPGMDGYEATQKLRALNAAGARVPIVALTANAMVGDRERCLEAGMSHYLSKPISVAALSKMLETVLAESSTA